MAASDSQDSGPENGSTLNAVPIVLQAGAIAVKIDREEPLFLVVTAKKDPHAWVFPKGHIESGETLEQAALRELREEAGVEGSALASVGSSSFVSGTERVTVTYCLVSARNEGPSCEDRQLRWLPAGQARSQLSFDDARRLLDRAIELLQQIKRGNASHQDR